MKKLFAMLLALILVLSSCPFAMSEETNSITHISGLTDLLIGYDMMAKEVRGEKATLCAYTVEGTAKDAIWASSDPAVATIDENGVLWAKSVGQTEVIAANESGSVSVTVTVRENMSLEDVVNAYFLVLLDLGDTDSMTADDLTAKGNEYFYVPHTVEGTDEEIIEAAKNRVLTAQVAFYCKAEAYYLEALAKEPDHTEASAQLEALYQYRDLIKRLDPDGQGIAFTWFSNRNALENEQMNAFAYDDVFFFAEPQYRGMDTLLNLVGDGTTAEGIDQKIAVYRFNAIYLGKGGAYTEISRFYIDKNTYPNYPKSMDLGIDYLKWSFDSEVVFTTDFKGPRYLGDYYTSGWINDNGEWVEPDYEKAVACYNIALSNKGAFDLTACMKMAFWYYDGEIVEKNDTLAFAYLLYGFYNGKNLHATQTNMPEGLLMMAKLFRDGVENVLEADNAMAATFCTYAYKSAQAMLGHNDEVQDADMEAVMAESEALLSAIGGVWDETIVIGDAANDFDAAFQTLLKPYISVIGTYLGVKGVK